MAAGVGGDDGPTVAVRGDGIGPLERRPVVELHAGHANIVGGARVDRHAGGRGEGPGSGAANGHGRRGGVRRRRGGVADAGVAAQLPGRVHRSHTIAVGGAGDAAGVAVTSDGRSGDLGEIGTGRARAALHAVAGHPDVVGRGRPGQIDLGGARGRGGEAAGHRRGLGVPNGDGAGAGGRGAAAGDSQAGGGGPCFGVADAAARVGAAGRVAAREGPGVGVGPRGKAATGIGPGDALAHVDGRVGGRDGTGCRRAQGWPRQRQPNGQRHPQGHGRASSQAGLEQSQTQATPFRSSLWRCLIGARNVALVAP